MSFEDELDVAAPKSPLSTSATASPRARRLVGDPGSDDPGADDQQVELAARELLECLCAPL